MRQWCAVLSVFQVEVGPAEPSVESGAHLCVFVSCEFQIFHCVFFKYTQGKRRKKKTKNCCCGSRLSHSLFSFPTDSDMGT